MPDLMTNTPVVMSISSHDPSGGTGISADIETLSSLGCHCTPIITKLSARDTKTLKDSQVIDAGLLIEQIRSVLEDIEVRVIKIGELGTVENTEAVATIMRDYPDIAVVLHPNINHPDNRASSAAMRALLLPLAKITVFKKSEALALAPGADTLSSCAQALMEYGCSDILITTTNANSTDTNINNHWYSTHHRSQEYSRKRLPHSYYGAGNTLSAAISAYLAHGISLAEAIQEAQQFTWQSLKKARRIGMGNLLPDRMHWCRK